MRKSIVVSLLCLLVGACGGSTGAAPAPAANGQWNWNRLGPTTDTPRYDYPGPALTGGCVC